MAAEAAVDVEMLRRMEPPSSGLRHLVDGVVDFLAGTAGGVAAVYAGQPLDTVKVKMQSFPETYKNGWQCIYQTFRQDRLRGLYVGSVPALAANVAENSVLFAAYGACQKAIANAMDKADDSADLTPLESAFAGSMAAVFATFVLCPTELVKCRMQGTREMAEKMGRTNIKLSGPVAVTKDILRQDGVKGLFRGFMPTAVREVPGYFFFFGAYEGCRYLLTPAESSRNELSLLKTCICGGTAGVAFWVSIFPADVVKSRIQVQGSGSFVSVFASILRQTGVAGLYSGLGPAVVRTFFASSALFVAYETVQQNLKRVVSSLF